MEYYFKRAFQTVQTANDQVWSLEFGVWKMTQPVRIRPISTEIPFGLCQSEVKTENIHSKMKSYLFGLYAIHNSTCINSDETKKKPAAKPFIQADTHHTEWNINDNKNHKLFVLQNNAENYVPANK